MKFEKYPEKELTGKIIGLAYKVYNDLGPGYPEKIYRNTICSHLEDENINFKTENYCKIVYNGRRIGHFFIDIIVEDKVVVELKARGEIYKNDIAQILTYMKSEGVKVGLILLFNEPGVQIKRLVL